MPDIHMTSFFASKKLDQGITPLSCAVYQPKGFKYPKVMWTDIRDDEGNWIRPRLFVNEENPLNAYWEAMRKHYLHRQDEALAWLDSFRGPVALCCWCPYDRAAQRQLKEFGTFICHTGPLGEFLEDLGAVVWYDEDRRKLAHPSDGR